MKPLPAISILVALLALGCVTGPGPGGMGERDQARPIGSEFHAPEPDISQGCADEGIFVSPSGSDEGSGSSDSPYKTIQHALDSSGAGAVINLDSGIYREAVRIRHPDVTIRSMCREWAVIEGPVDDEEGFDAMVYFDPEASGGSLKRLEIIGGYYYGVVFQTRWDWGDPSDRSGASDMLIEDCLIHGTGRDAVKVTPGCDDVRIEGSEIYDTGMRDGSNAEGIDNVNGDRMIVRDSYIHDIATSCLYFKGGSTGTLVERNRIERCGAGGIMAGFDTSPEYFDLIANPDYYESIDGVVRNNIISDTAYAGIGMYAAKGAQVYNNTLVDTAKEGHGAIYFGVTFQDWEPGAGRPPSADPYVHDNVIVQRSSEGPMVAIRYADELGGLRALSGMIDMGGNCYHSSSGPALFEDSRPGSVLEDGSLMDWQLHISSDKDSVEADPRLTSDLLVPVGSPCQGRGAG